MIIQRPISRSGRSALFRAAFAGHEDCVEILIDHGGAAAAAVRDREGKTAFHVAAAAGQIHALMALAAPAKDGEEEGEQVTKMKDNKG